MIWGVEGRHLWIPPSLVAMMNIPADLPNLPAMPIVGRRNLVTNPNADNNLTDWTKTGAAAFTRASAVGGTDAPPPAGHPFFFFLNTPVAGDYAEIVVPVVSGHTYRFSAYVGSKYFRFQMINAAGTIKATTGYLSYVDGLGRADIGFTADSTGNWKLRLRSEFAGAGTGMSWAGVMAEEASVLNPYGDGDMAGWGWTAAQGNSTSQQLLYSAADPQPVSLNRRIDDTLNAVWPVYWVKKIGGLMSLGESDDSRHNRVGAEGEIPRRSFRRGKTITYEGSIRALSRASLRQAEETLRKACNSQADEGMVVVTPHPSYDGSGHFAYYPARVLTVEIADEANVNPSRASRGHESGFVVALRNSRAGGHSYFDQDDIGYP